MTTTPPPMPEPLCIDDHEARFSKAQIEARDAKWMERITALEALLLEALPYIEEGEEFNKPTCRVLSKKVRATLENTK